MLNFFKSIFIKDEPREVELFIQNKSHGMVSVRLLEDTLQLLLSAVKADKERALLADIVLEVKDLRDLSHQDDELLFICKDKKYKLNGKNLLPLYQKLHPLICQSYLFEAEEVSYFTYNASSRQFEQYKNPVTLKIYINTKYYLRIDDENKIIHFEEISTDTQYYVDQPNNSFVWSIYSDGKFYTFCLKFKSSLSFLEFKSKHAECMFKSANSEQEYNRLFNDFGASTVSLGTLVDDDKQQKESEESSSDAEEDRAAVDSSFTRENRAGGSNEHLIMGLDRCYVTRGGSLGVFDLSSNNLKFRTQIKNALHSPKKILTHNSDTSLLILDKGKTDELGVLDLARGEVVEKWKVDDDMNDYFDSVKNTDDSTLVGLSDRSLFRIDPRVKDKVVERKEYKMKNEFSCGVGTSKGGLAVASRKGDLRLYDKLGKNAKTLLPGFGEEVKGIDTTADGSVVICTCKNYILVYFVDSNYSKNCKSVTPKRLQMKPQHATLLQEEISFAPAKFDQNDTLIITSTGKFVIRWRVSDIQDGKYYDYSIKQLNEKIVDEDFIVNGRDIVVALKNDVRKMNERDLRRPGF